MVPHSPKLSEAEMAALRWLRDTPCNLVSRIDDKPSVDVFGDIVPGLTTFRRLEKKGLCFQTEEDPVYFTDDPSEEPFYFTESIELTDDGVALARKL